LRGSDHGRSVCGAAEDPEREGVTSVSADGGVKNVENAQRESDETAGGEDIATLKDGTYNLRGRSERNRSEGWWEEHNEKLIPS